MHSKVTAALFLSSLAMAAPAVTDEPSGVGMPVVTLQPAIWSAEEAVASSLPQSIREELVSAYAYNNMGAIQNLNNYIMHEIFYNSAWRDRVPASDLALFSSGLFAPVSATSSILIPGNSAVSLTAGSSTPLATATGTGGSGSAPGSGSASGSGPTTTSTSTTASGSKPTTTNGATAPTSNVAASLAGAAGLLGVMLAL